MVHVLWECPDYKDSRDIFNLETSIVERSSFVLGCELWEENFGSLLNCSGGIHVLDPFIGC